MQGTQPSPAYMTFAGAIDALGVQRVFQMFAVSTQNQISEIHLLLHSLGGNVSDGVCLYNYFSTFPLHITVYNVGSVGSAAALAYLGAHERFVSEKATFVIHRSSATLQGASAAAIQARVASLIMDDKRCEKILRTHLHMPNEKWAAHENHDLWLDADEAIQSGLATKIGDFAAPKGVPIFNVLQ